MGLMDKVTRFASSPQGRRTISGFMNRGTTTGGGTTAGGGMPVSGSGSPTARGTGGGAGMVGRLASGLLRNRRR